MADTPKVYGYMTQAAGYRISLLTRAYTRTYFFQGPSDDAGLTGGALTNMDDPANFITVYDDVAGTAIQVFDVSGNGTTITMPQVGMLDTLATGNGAVCTSVDSTVWDDSANQLRVTATFEGTTGNCLWNENGYVAQELTNYDNEGNLTQVKYSPPAGTAGATANINLNNPHIANLPRFVDMTVRTCVWYTADPGWSAGIQRFFLATVNDDSWGGTDPDLSKSYSKSLVVDDNPRTWLCTKFEATSNNGLYRVEVQFLRRNRTWDELGLYLTLSNTLPPGAQPQIPDEVTYPTDDSLFDQGTAPYNPNGIKRFKLQGEQSFKTYFTAFNRIAPQFLHTGVYQ